MDTKSIARKIGLASVGALNTPAKRLGLMVGIAASCAVTALAHPPLWTNGYTVPSGQACNQGDVSLFIQGSYQYCCPGTFDGAGFDYYNVSYSTCYYG